MASNVDALAALEARHADELRALEEEAATLRAGASKKRLKEINFQLAQRESDLRYRHSQELDELDGGAESEATEEDAGPTAAELKAQKEKEEREAAERKKAKAARKRGKKADKAAEKQKRAAAMAAESLELEKTSKRTKEMAAIDAKLAPEGLRVHEVAADGHCLFRAVAHQAGEDFASLRRRCADHMEAAPDDYLVFVVPDAADPAAAFAEHCRRVRETAEWGGQPELLALARVLRRPVWVHSRDAPLLKMGGADAPPLVLTYHRDYYALGEHYNSTAPR
mmetsp:Transcript_7866/g.23412  ORF Transcript_7866/g.23412 Transcript_7866/m.23412 type:complete len:281 (+) Transcript_7866:135-977(+)